MHVTLTNLKNYSAEAWDEKVQGYVKTLKNFEDIFTGRVFKMVVDKKQLQGKYNEYDSYLLKL